MRRWEYLELYVHDWRWANSRGEVGMIEKIEVQGAFTRRNLAPLFNELGRAGWEMLGIEPNDGKYTVVFKRALGGDD